MTTRVPNTPVSVAVPQPQSAAAGTPVAVVLTASQLNAVVVAIKTFREAHGSLRNGLLVALGIFPPPDKSRRVAVSSRRVRATPMLAELQRELPAIHTHVDPDAIDAGLAVGRAVQMLVNDLQTFIPSVQSCGRLATADAWVDASTIYGVATALARSNTDMAARVAPVDQILKRGKRVDTAAAVVAATGHLATKAQQRAANAGQRATRATRTQTRAAQAHADNHPVPASPVPLANPQGPAASADVAPQGPAPGR